METLVTCRTPNPVSSPPPTVTRQWEVYISKRKKDDYVACLIVSVLSVETLFVNHMKENQKERDIMDESVALTVTQSEASCDSGSSDWVCLVCDAALLVRVTKYTRVVIIDHGAAAFIIG